MGGPLCSFILAMRWGRLERPQRIRGELPAASRLRCPLRTGHIEFLAEQAGLGQHDIEHEADDDRGHRGAGHLESTPANLVNSGPNSPFQAPTTKPTAHEIQPAGLKPARGPGHWQPASR